MPAPTNGGKRKLLTAVLLTVLALTQFGCGGPSSKVSIEQLRSKNSAERLHAVKALAKKRREAEVVAPALAVALKDENAFVRRDAAEALGELGAGAKPAFSALEEAARDKNAEVRKQAANALKRIDPQAAANAGVR
jgi:HEAT repeat protein